MVVIAVPVRFYGKLVFSAQARIPAYGVVDSRLVGNDAEQNLFSS